MNMSKSERWCYEFIKKFMLENQYAPSVDEIAAGLGYKSKSTVANLLSSLRKKGMITWEDGKSRTIRVKGIMIEEV